MLKLSDAIRLGAMLRPQAFGWFYDNGGSCAWGAAHEAVGEREQGKSGMCLIAHDAQQAEVRWPVSLIRTDCPECAREVRLVGQLIPHLNDDHKWTRERIADFVATFEPKPEPVEVRVSIPLVSLKAGG